MIIYIDHFIIVSISRQIILTIFNINKLNFRLIKIFQYLLSFNLIIRYKINKLNVISNAFSRLSKTNSDIILNVFFKMPGTSFDSSFENFFDVFYDYAVEILDSNLIKITKTKVVYHITLIEILNDFKI